MHNTTLEREFSRRKRALIQSYFMKNDNFEVNSQPEEPPVNNSLLEIELLSRMQLVNQELIEKYRLLKDRSTLDQINLPVIENSTGNDLDFLSLITELYEIFIDPQTITIDLSSKFVGGEKALNDEVKRLREQLKIIVNIYCLIKDREEFEIVASIALTFIRYIRDLTKNIEQIINRNVHFQHLVVQPQIFIKTQLKLQKLKSAQIKSICS